MTRPTIPDVSIEHVDPDVSIEHVDDETVIARTVIDGEEQEVCARRCADGVWRAPGYVLADATDLAEWLAVFSSQTITITPYRVDMPKRRSPPNRHERRRAGALARRRRRR